MAEVIKVYDAKTHLSALLARVETGESFVIVRGSEVIADLTPHRAPTTRDLGFLDLDVPDSFFDPLPDDELLPPVPARAHPGAVRR